MRRVLITTIIAVVFVTVIEWLNHLGVATVQTFAVLLPGIFIACISPDAACGAMGDLHAPGLVAIVLLNVVNVAFYYGLAYFVWSLAQFMRQNSK